MDWLLISIGLVIVVIAITLYRLLNQVKYITSYLNQQPAKQILNNPQYDEEEILKHLDRVVQEAIDEYTLYNITPLSVEYINRTTEQNMIDSLSESIPERISPILLDKLSYVYNRDYIGKYIGNYIFMKVTEFVIEFNNTSNK